MSEPSKIDFIVDSLKRIETNQVAQGEKIYDMHGKVSQLEVKASIFGMIGGVIVAVVAALRGHG